MEINAALAAGLSALSEALDDPYIDVGETLARLAADARSAVAAYLGVAISMTVNGDRIVLTALEDGARPEDVVSSIMLALGAATDIALVLFASRPGAFVDLAADLTWMSGRDPTQFVLDRHLDLAGDTDGPSALAAISVVNQAIGVLIARGYSAEQAAFELEARAGAAGHDRVQQARVILAGLPEGSPTDERPSQ